jgi:hypothetical protein
MFEKLTNCKKSSWSITCQMLNQEGHSGRIIQGTVHPVIEVELAASLDSIGYCFLTWIPLVLREKQFLLLIGHSQGFDCVIVRKDSADKETTIQHEMACTVQLPVPMCKQKLECIHTTLLAAMPLDNCIK